MTVSASTTQAAFASTGEPAATALLLSVIGVLLLLCVVLSRTVDRMGIPIVLLFLVLGMLGGSEGLGGIPFEDYQFAARVGTAALVLILFDGGMNTSVQSIRAVLAPSCVLATLGVLLTAAFIAGFARLIGLGWPEALLLGAVVSSTDAAAVFAVLRGGRLSLKPQLGRTIEVESCINDPMAVILTTSMIALMTSQGEASIWTQAISVPVQLVVGAIVGWLLGYLGSLALRRVRLGTAGLYPVMTLGLAFFSFGVATLLQGSGFLAVYATAVVLGNGRLPYRSGLTHIHDALGWLSQASMFLMLGLLVFPSQLLPVAWIGIGISLFLALVARPIAVWLCLLPFRYPAREVGYIGWVGLRGAVPIILATFPVLAQVPGSERIFNIVFFIVVVSSLVPGASIRSLTRRMKLNTPEKPVPSAMLEMNALHRLNGDIVPFHISADLAVAGAQLSELSIPGGASVVLVIRGNDLLPARGNTVLQPGDHAYVFFQPEDRPLIELLFGSPETG